MKTSKIKFLFFLVVLGIVLYYWGQPHPFQQFKHDVSNIFNGKNEKKKEPWTREGREDNVASDTKENDTEAADNEASDTKSSSKKDNSIVDILKDAVEEGTKTLPNIKDEVFKDNSSSNVVFKDLDKYKPYSSKDKEIVRHTGYMLSYQEDYEQASWVLHLLKSEAAKGTEPRSNEFMADPEVSTGSAVTQDYSRSGYDRGHLCPAGDFKYDHELQNETFYMSNMSPQAPDFNRGIWSDLESRIRKWAQDRGDLIVVTGPILRQGLEFIGKRNQIAVPEYYYKIVYDPRDKQAIAFLMPNQASYETVRSFAVSIDSIEKKTGIDFFAKLPESLQKQIESEVNVDDWF